VRDLAAVVLVVVVFLCLTVLPDPALGAIDFGERLPAPAPTDVALAGAEGMVSFKC